jgi:hypothetical protein
MKDTKKPLNNLTIPLRFLLFLSLAGCQRWRRGSCLVPVAGLPDTAWRSAVQKSGQIQEHGKP